MYIKYNWVLLLYSFPRGHSGTQALFMWIFSGAVLSNMLTTILKRLLSTWNVANVK